MTGKDIRSRSRHHRVIARLNREQLDFLDKIGKDALFSSGVKLSRTKILSAMVDVFRRLEIDGHGISSDRELERRIIQAIRRLAERQTLEV
jgi:hypothetical protein